MSDRPQNPSCAPPPQAEFRERRLSLTWIAPLALGVALRGYQLGSQVLAGDELHALNAAVARSASEIIHSWTYFGADYCIPLAAFFRLLMAAGVPLSEGMLRAPGLLAGCVAIVVLPALFAPRIGRRAATWMAWLIALSPSLVLYSRLVRSYMPMVLLSVAAVLAFERWWRTRSRRAAAAYVLLSAFAVYFHLGAAAFVFSPFLYAAGETLGRALRLRSAVPVNEAARRSAALGAVSVAFLALLLWPARGSLIELVTLHGDGHFPQGRTWVGILQLQLGSHFIPVVVLAGALAARGAWVLARRSPAFAVYLLFVSVAQVVSLALLSPHHLQFLHVASRYVLPLLPLLLAVVAVGLASPVTRAVKAPSHRLQAAAGAVFLALLFATGPLARLRFRESSFVHSETALTFGLAQDRIELQDVPKFYRELGQRLPMDEPIIEFPWMNVSAHAFDAYQRVHRHPVRVASLNRLHGDPRLALGNTLSPKPEALLASGARYLIVHLDLPAEEARVITQDPFFEQRLREMDELWRILRRAGEQMARRTEDAWGPPDVFEAVLRVWDLDRIRAREPRRPLGAPRVGLRD